MTTGENLRRKHFLFVDDEAAFLEAIRELFTEMSRGSWEIFTATTHAQALAELQRQRMDVVVLDLGMPTMDGIQLLRLLGRTHPDQPKVMLTGRGSDEDRKASLENGAVLFLQKPTAANEFKAIFSALDALAGAQPQEGFKGVMQRVGLHEVLQFECLARRSSILEIFTGKVRGRIFIHDGAIIHAESGTLQGEVALYSLLALRGGEFNLMVFAEPPRRTIAGSWEMLLMESARLSDEAALPFTAEAPPALPPSVEMPTPRITEPEPPQPDFPSPLPAASEDVPVRILEVLLCSGAGEVLYDWECKSLERRLELMEQIEQQSAQLSALASVGRLDRLEVLTAEGRLVCQIQPDRRLLVRSAPTEPSSQHSVVSSQGADRRSPTADLRELISQRMPLPGVAAWASRRPDHTVVYDTYSDWFTPAQIDQTVARVVLAAENLDRHRLRPVRLCWVFDHARIHLAPREDGNYLALFVENRPDLPTHALTQVLTEFLALPKI